MTRTNYRTLTTRELISVAERDARFLNDPLFAELVARLAGEPRSGLAPEGRYAVGQPFAPTPLHIDARR